MSEKVYLGAQQLLEDSFRLGAEVVKSGFRPTMMIAIWRGGAPVGVASQHHSRHDWAFTTCWCPPWSGAVLKICVSS